MADATQRRNLVAPAGTHPIAQTTSISATTIAPMLVAPMLVAPMLVVAMPVVVVLIGSVPTG